MSVSLSYSMIIEWSDEDQIYIVRLPEFGPGARTHGDSYEDAAKNGREVLEMLVESYIADGETLPLPLKYVDADGPVKSQRSRVPSRSKRQFKITTTPAKQR